MTDKIDKDCVKSQALQSVIVRRHPRFVTKALINAGGRTFVASIGRSGISALKREGDGATPLASMRIIHGFYRADRVRIPPTRLEMQPIKVDDGWCDAPQHACYNRSIRLPFDHSSETLRRDDMLYDICLVLDWNYHARSRHCGSAIFLHIANPYGKATEGCVAVSPKAMCQLLQHIKRGTIVRVV